MKMESTYINTDLNIVSNKNLSDLADILKKKCELLHSKKEKDGLWYICVEAKGSGIIGDKNHNHKRDLEKLLKIVEGFNEITKNILKKSRELDFNIGWQSSNRRPEGSFSLPIKLLQRIANVGATLTVTIYPSNELEAEICPNPKLKKYGQKRHKNA